MLSFPVEKLILKMYAHFSYHAGRVDELLTCVQNDDETPKEAYKSVKAHVKNRFQSLAHVCEDVGKKWKTLVLYFRTSQTDDKKAATVKNLLFDDQGDEKKLAFPSLLFLKFVSKQMTKTCLKFEGKNVVLADVGNDINGTIDTLEKLKSNKNPGFEAQQALNLASPTERQTFLSEVTDFYARVIDYLKTYSTKMANEIALFSPFSLRDEQLPTLEQIQKLGNAAEEDFDYGELELELLTIEQELANLKQSKDWKKGNTVDRWDLIVNSGSYPCISKLLQHVLHLPASSCTSERIFSSIGHKWTKFRFSMLLETLTATLQVALNTDMTFKEFYKYLMENETLLIAIKGTDKYH